VGGWSDLGIYVGAIALFSFISLERLKLERPLKIAVSIILVFAFFLLSVISFDVVWYVLAASAVVFFIYNYSFRKSGQALDDIKKLPLISLAVLVVACVFILFRGNIYSTLSAEPFNLHFLDRFAISNVEVRPSIQSTYKVALDSIKHEPVVGIGPNRFINQWLKSKPDDVNTSLFWGTDFNYGFGLIPTFLITTGPLGFIAWILFLGYFIYLGFKAIFVRRQDPLRDYITSTSFIIAMYFWIFSIIYVPSSVLLVLTFFFTGLFFASLLGTNTIEVKTFDFVKDPKMSFISVLLFVALLLGGLISAYGISRRFISAYYFNKGLVAANVKGDIKESEANLIRAVQFSEDDQYYRTISELNLIQINILLQQKNVSQEVVQNQFRSYLGAAQSAAQAARDYDKTNYENWLALGRVAESVVPFNLEGAYETALAAYKEAQKLNPKNPALYLILSRLEVAHKDITKAKEYITEALKLKSNYTDAIFFLSQIQVNQGDLKSAIQSVEAASLITPSDPGVYFQLGLLRYNDKNYTGAASAFEQAIVLAKDYANAKYFLGLSYSKLNRNADAIKLFEELKATNSDNQEINLILSNLKANKDPFANAQPPLDNKPEKRSRPPVEEKNVGDTQPSTADR
jgi:tetratricopeptide (TPR) repeat protein